jgi:diguanylate cyclase (GGDEF)-like protein
VVRVLSISGDPRFGPEGAFVGYRGVGRDVTEIALARERIASLAYSDPLTGLANRTSLMPALDQAVQRARRRNAKLAVVFLDLDGFKQINDQHGHDAGDALLIELAARLRDNLRASDLIARLGGDEFLVVLEEVQDTEPVEIVAKKLLTETVRPYTLPGAQASVTASIGISIFPDDAADATALMKHADIAMYAAKQAGKNTCRFYSSGPAANDPTRRSDANSGSGS